MSSKDPEKEKEEQDKQVELWKVKKLIKSLMLARGYVFIITIKFVLHVLIVSVITFSSFVEMVQV